MPLKRGGGRGVTVSDIISLVGENKEINGFDIVWHYQI